MKETNGAAFLLYLLATGTLGACTAAGDGANTSGSESRASTATQTEATPAAVDAPLGAELTDDGLSIVDDYLTDLGFSYESIDASRMISPPQQAVSIIESNFANPDSSVRPAVTRLQPILVMAARDEQTPRAITPGPYWIAEIGGLPLPAPGFSPDRKPEPPIDRAVTAALLRDEADQVALTLTRTWPAAAEVASTSRLEGDQNTSPRGQTPQRRPHGV